MCHQVRSKGETFRPCAFISFFGKQGGSGEFEKDGHDPRSATDDKSAQGWAFA